MHMFSRIHYGKYLLIECQYQMCRMYKQNGPEHTLCPILGRKLKKNRKVVSTTFQTAAATQDKGMGVVIIRQSIFVWDLD